MNPDKVNNASIQQFEGSLAVVSGPEHRSLLQRATMTKFPDITRRPASRSTEVHSLRGSAKGSPLGDDVRSMPSNFSALSRGQVKFRAAKYGRVYSGVAIRVVCPGSFVL